MDCEFARMCACIAGNSASWKYYIAKYKRHVISEVRYNLMMCPLRNIQEFILGIVWYTMYNDLDELI